MTAVQISKHSLFRLKITVGCRLCAYPSNHFSLDEEDTLKITVGCRLCAYPSILLSPDEDTLKITVGCRLCAYPSILLFLTKTLSRSRSVVDRAHFQAFTFSSQDHGRLSIVHVSKHSCVCCVCWVVSVVCGVARLGTRKNLRV